MRHVLTAVTLLALLLPCCYAQDAPAKMIHIVVEMKGTDIPADSFGAKPKTIWRAADKYCRIDEEPDPEQGIHATVIINEPDVWMVNLADKSARHIVDEGPTFNCRLPIFATDQDTAKSKVGELEFGRELDFFKKNGARKIDGPKLSFEANYFEVTFGKSSVLLVERVDIHAPIMIAFVSGEKRLQVKYALWEEIPFRLDLFAAPTGVKIEEAKAATSQ